MSFLSSFWDALWLLFSVFVFIAYLMALFAIITDLFRDRHLGGFAKALWLLFLVFLPFLTALVYLVTRGKGMSERATHQAQQARDVSEEYLRSVVQTGPSEEIARAHELLTAGAITDEEFATLKSAALARTSS